MSFFDDEEVTRRAVRTTTASFRRRVSRFPMFFIPQNYVCVDGIYCID
jgi:hypothetical protein